MVGGAYSGGGHYKVVADTFIHETPSVVEHTFFMEKIYQTNLTGKLTKGQFRKSVVIVSHYEKQRQC